MLSRYFLKTLFLTVFLSSFQLLAQTHELKLVQLVLGKTYSVHDSITGFYTEDSSFVYHGAFKEMKRGNVYVEGTYTYGQKSGTWKKYYDNGHLCTKGMYVEDKPHGAWRYYYDTDTLASICYYNAGKRTGVWLGNGFNGRKIAELHFDSAENQILAKYFYSSGDIMRQDSLYFDNQDTITVITKYYKNGEVFQHYRTKGKQMHGEFFQYYLNGQLWEQLSYQNNEIQEVKAMKNYYGKDLKFKNLEENIQLQRYHKNGDVWVRYLKENGDTMRIIYYDVDEIKDCTGEIIKGKPTGLWKYFRYEELISTTEFIDGFDDYKQDRIQNGKKVKGNFSLRKGLLTGNYKEYNSFNEISCDYYYSLGYFHGPYKRLVNENGILEEGEMIFGTPVGVWNYTSIATGKLLRTWNFQAKPRLDTSLLKSVNYEFELGNQVISDFNPDFKVSGINLSYYKPITQLRDVPFVYYPKEAYEKKIEGEIELRCEIDMMGDIRNVKIVRGIGFDLEDEAVRMLRRSPFTDPVLYCGMPLPSTAYITIPFYLSDDIKFKKSE